MLPLRNEATVIVASVLVWLVGGAFDNQLIDKFLYVMPGLLLAMAHLVERAPVTAGASISRQQLRDGAIEGPGLALGPTA